MGESRERERGGAEGPAVMLLSLILDRGLPSRGTVENIQIQSATDTVYAVRIYMRGDAEPEAFYVTLPDPEPDNTDAEGRSPESGGDQ